jgi:putative ABC transport system permease protein
LLLLTAAGLLLKDFARIRGGSIGVRTDNVWTAAVSLPKAKYGEQQQQFSLSQALLEKLRHAPGVESVAISNRMPLEGGSNGYIALRGVPTPPMSGPLVESHAVTPGYLKVMGIPLIQGRDFNEQDVQTELNNDIRLLDASKTSTKLSDDVLNGMVYPVLVNQTMAKSFWKDQNPIGKMFLSGGGSHQRGPWKQVVGVVGDVKQWGLFQPPQPEAYDVDDGDLGFFVVAHASAAGLDLTSEVRHALGEIDSSVPLYQVRTMDEVISENASGQEFLTALVGLFSGLALLLAAIGIYGVLSYLVTQRTREIGIRMSLGAQHSDVVGLVLGRGMRLAAIGFAVGLVAAVAAGRLLTGLLHEVRPTDPVTIAATLAALAAVALLACYLPARRAARVEPVIALRHE